MAKRNFSHQREAIKENISARKDHPTAEMIYSDLRMTHPNISLGTVYRNLSLLVEAGDVKKVSSGNGTLRYDGNLAPHSHFICVQCSAVKDIFVQVNDSLIPSAEEACGELIDDCVVTYFGTCKSCREKAAQ